MSKILWKAEFTANEAGNPVWRIPWVASIIKGIVIGLILGAWILVVEL